MTEGDHGRLHRLEKFLHSKCMHPDFIYATTDGPRKAFEPVPPDDGCEWEPNVDVGRDGWERFDYHEEAYWRRPKASVGDGRRGDPQWCATVVTNDDGATGLDWWKPEGADGPDPANPLWRNEEGS